MRPDILDELLIWRPILDGLVTIGEVNRGEVDLIDLMKLNDLLDMKAALERRAMQQSKAE